MVMGDTRLAHLGQWVHDLYFNKKSKHSSWGTVVIPKKNVWGHWLRASNFVSSFRGSTKDKCAKKHLFRGLTRAKHVTLNRSPEKRKEKMYLHPTLIFLPGVSNPGFQKRPWMKHWPGSDDNDENKCLTHFAKMIARGAGAPRPGFLHRASNFDFHSPPEAASVWLEQILATCGCIIPQCDLNW